MPMTPNARMRHIVFAQRIALALESAVNLLRKPDETYNRSMATQTLPYVTPEQYLECDRNSDVRNEYIAGEVLPMVSVTESHSLIVANVVHSLKARLSGSPCRVYASGPRTILDPKKGYVYPDVMVVCGERQYLDAKRDTVTNPKIAVEVLSPSTMNYDLGVKARLYWAVASLSDLIIIEQDKIEIEYWHRANDGEWKKTIIEDPNGILKIESVSCEIPVSEIYEGVELPPDGE
jgi:Uma2 family endonuclease